MQVSKMTVSMPSKPQLRSLVAWISLSQTLWVEMRSVRRVLKLLIYEKGWTKMTNFADLDAMDDDDWDKCWSVNVKSSFHLFKAALPTFNANPEGGVFLITASTAVSMALGRIMEMADSDIHSHRALQQAAAACLMLCRKQHVRYHPHEVHPLTRLLT
jgi:NAD(P)-dependent dehydrogenase (short-subunit alcohol dehydrogenase family)